MILQREQINRYLRHIIMPEISGPGQKKLLESAVSIYGENVDGIATAVYYLAASGLGRIYCSLDDAEGFDGLRSNVNDLNGDVSIELATYSGDFRIFIGSAGFMPKIDAVPSGSFVPSIVAMSNGWKGGMQVFRAADGLDSFLSELKSELKHREIHCAGSQTGAANGNTLSSCLLGALIAMEVIKLALGLGEPDDGLLFFDLLSLEFMRNGQAASQYGVSGICDSRRDSRHDSRHTSLDQAKLKDARVLIAGTGGLGSPTAYALALSGIGTLGLVDYDVVDISNLNRQILHSTSRIGRPKVESAEAFLKKLRPDLDIRTYNAGISRENVFEIIEGYDVVIDAVDNFPTRFLLNDACYFARKSLIDAGVLRFNGTCTVVLPEKGPCYRCILSDIPAPGSVPSCSEAGVLGPVPGIMGFIQAAEAVKLLTGEGNLSAGKIIFFDGLFSDFRTAKLDKKSTCPLCGAKPVIHELQDYGFMCGIKEA